MADACLGGQKDYKPGYGSPNQIAFIAAVHTDWARRPLYIHLNRVPGFTRQAIDAWANQCLDKKAAVCSDGLDCFRSLEGNVYLHTACSTGSGRPSNFLFCRLNSLLGNLKRAMAGTCHAFNFDRYGGRYLAESQYRFNRRFDLTVILSRLIRAAACNQPRPEWWIRN